MRDFEHINWNNWGETVAGAFNHGARASSIKIFVSSGGASYGVVLMWPGEMLSALGIPGERARLSIALEEALPGWLWSAQSVPSKRDPIGWSSATYNLIPPDRSESGTVRLAFRGEGKELGVLARALNMLDVFVGAPSWRIKVDGCFTTSDVSKGRRPSVSSLSVSDDLVGRLSPNEFAGHMSALACEMLLENEVKVYSKVVFIPDHDKKIRL